MICLKHIIPGDQTLVASEWQQNRMCDLNKNNEIRETEKVGQNLTLFNFVTLT